MRIPRLNEGLTEPGYTNATALSGLLRPGFTRMRSAPDPAQRNSWRLDDEHLVIVMSGLLVTALRHLPLTADRICPVAPNAGKNQLVLASRARFALVLRTRLSDPFESTYAPCCAAAFVGANMESLPYNSPEAALGAVAEAGAAPSESPLTMVAAASPAAPMDFRAVEALFL
ncbi:hypothetical protein [Curtobacterium citreum]|uniref:Uncharacterized protein n=1 Tax=Curtobacterium citreum TaxID=2036 RepID=A0ABU8Y959_9MICO